MKKIIFLFIFIVVLGGFWYGYHEFNRKASDLSSASSDIHLDAKTLISAFETDSSSANKKYTDKIISVNGTVKQIDTNGNPIIVFLGIPGQMSSVKCSMDSTHSMAIRNMKQGTNVTIKGRCTGGQTQDLFGTDVTLNYCVIENK